MKTFLEFKEYLENNPNEKKKDTKTLAKKLGVSEEILGGWRVLLKSYQRIPSSEELEMMGYPLKSSTKPANVSGFQVSSFKVGSNGQVSEAWYKSKEEEEEDTKVSIEELISRINQRPASKKSCKCFSSSEKENCSIELFLTDFHINRLILGGVSVESRIEDYKKLVTSSLGKASKLYNIEEVVYVIGSDFFNSDGFHAETKNKTVQNNSMYFFEAFEYGYKLVTDVIEHLLSVSDRVKLIMLPGNHDTTSAFYLGKAVEAYFRQESRLITDCSFNFRKVHTYKNTSWMYHHGNEKLELIVSQFADFFPTEFTNNLIEVHTGDKHHVLVKEVGRAIIRQFPALVDSDMWTFEKGYKSRAKLLAQIYTESGRVGEIEERLN